MKKILIVLLLFPIIINAKECDYETFNEHIKLSGNIEYEVSYDDGKYSVTLYNVYNGIYLVYNNKMYMPNVSNEVIINNIDEGTYMKITVNSDAEDCSSFIKSLNINIGYYNDFYDSNECEEYKGILTICTEQFLSYKTNRYLLETVINNYKSSYTEKSEVKEEIKEITFFDSVQDFVNEWGILIILIILSSLITSIIFRNVFRKIKHGI